MGGWAIPSGHVPSPGQQMGTRFWQYSRMQSQSFSPILHLYTPTPATRLRTQLGTYVSRSIVPYKKARSRRTPFKREQLVPSNECVSTHPDGMRRSAH